ncbi:MAG: glycosyltransferase family 2 protein [Deltaproteobacteria bacterium]|nr:glycosyltransferase family 2 protein [Deltaproteobacteria bacterium]
MPPHRQQTTEPAAPHLDYLRRLVAKEISNLTRHADQVLQWRPLPHDSGALLHDVDGHHKRRLATGPLPNLDARKFDRSVVLLNGTLNHDLDIQSQLTSIRDKLGRGSRVVVVAYNPYLRGLYRLAHHLGLRQGEVPTCFVTATDLQNLAKLSGLEVVRTRPVGFFPLHLMGLGTAVNKLASILPGVRRLGLVSVLVLRPTSGKWTKDRPSLSVVIPARNERGNIEAAAKRLQPLARSLDLEVIFVEGHSEDGTWTEIQRVKKTYGRKLAIKARRQTGNGKADAVRLGFATATKDLATILDADLTVPPELLRRFYDAYCEGLGDFINGNRLAYPMEGEAMRFLNLLANVFFAKTLSAVLGTGLGDCLCGTKLLARRDCQRLAAWREKFGDFDPFGDFELLFPAAVLGLGVVDVPVRYRARTYGSTQISRFKHGLELLRMTALGFARILPGPG